ncbi:MAG: PorP/SprF family type IX secretion system membrane protein [Phycisphaerales bacterium]|nr:PorP/SprF family type IX secretion system membrane protein [Phycisphaerales bacterium]
MPSLLVMRLKPILIRITIILSISLTTLSYSTAQNYNYSQYFNVPILANPANTAVSTKSNYQVGAIYRDQYGAVGGQPYRSFGVWGDIETLGGHFKNGWGGIGVGVFNEIAGVGGLTATKGFVSLAYHQLIGIGSLLSFGANIGLVNKRVNLNKFSFNNQWNGIFFDNTISNSERFTTQSVTNFNLQAGLSYHYYLSQHSFIGVGASIGNLSQPYEGFFARGLDYRTPLIYNAFVNTLFILDNNLWTLNPNVYYTQTKNAYEVEIGLNGKRSIIEGGQGHHQILFGLYYRLADAIIPMIGYEVNSFKFSFSYDATVSKLSPYNSSRGAYELTFIKIGNFKRKVSNDVKCPPLAY